MTTLADQIVIARATAGYRQSQLAAALGVTAVHLCKIERGHGLPSVGLLQKIADLTRCTFSIDPNGDRRPEDNQ